MSATQLDAATVSRLAHISSDEIRQDIKDTEREIAEVLILGPMVEAAAFARHLAVNEARKVFIAKLRALLAARGEA